MEVAAGGKWCVALERRCGVSYLEVASPEFDRNVEWLVGWAVYRGPDVVWRKWYGMKDGAVVQVSCAELSPDSWRCEELEGAEKLKASIVADVRVCEPIVYVAGRPPSEILKILPERLVTRLP